MDGLETMSEKLQDAGVLITRLLIGRNDECGRNRLFHHPPCQVRSGDIDTRDLFKACDKRKVAEDADDSVKTDELFKQVLISDSDSLLLLIILLCYLSGHVDLFLLKT
jgi:hypothetical protein